jgi:short-subunit dehydrogenase
MISAGLDPRTYRTHVLTGAGSGIGLELARRLAERGDRLIMLVRSEERIDPLIAEIPTYGAVLVADLEEPAVVERVGRGIITGAPAIDRIDSLIHCAGVVGLGAVADADLVDWERQLTVNLISPAMLTRALLPALRAARGTVVFVNSGAGLTAHADWSAYAASKFGLRALADSLRAEEPALRVTSVFPGRTATPMQAEVHRQEGKEYDAARWINASSVADAILHVLDLGPDATIPELVVRPRP